MNETNIILDAYGLSIKGMDSAHVSFIDLFIDKSEFKEWECFDEVVIGLNLKNLIRILSIGKEDDDVIFEYTKDDDIITIIINSIFRKAEYELRLFTIESEILEIPDTDYITTININSNYYNQIINEILVVCSDTLEFEINKDKIYINSFGDIGKSRILLENLEKSETLTDTISESSSTVSILTSKLTPKKTTPEPKKII
jgi:proliferating cell nuclear antigen